MIITVTPNPSVDRTLFVDSLPRGALIRGARSRSEPSGKGVNVALALCANAFDVLAVFPVGGAAGTHMIEMLGASDVAHIAVSIAGAIRSNISIVEPDGTVTKINEAGPVLDAAEADLLIAAALDNLTTEVTWLAGCGSLPGGAGATIYRRLTVEGRRRGFKTAIDTSGPALRAAVSYGPDLVKPNLEELAEVSGCRLRSLGDVVDAAERLRQMGARTVLASLGADGAIIIDDDGALHGEAPIDRVVSPVGAGDALLAGFLSGGTTRRESLVTALSWAAAQVQYEGTLYQGTDVPVPVIIHKDIDLDRLLREPPRWSPSSGTPVPFAAPSRRRDQSSIPTVGNQVRRQGVEHIESEGVTTNG